MGHFVCVKILCIKKSGINFLYVYIYTIYRKVNIYGVVSKSSPRQIDDGNALIKSPECPCKDDSHRRCRCRRRIKFVTLW